MASGKVHLRRCASYRCCCGVLRVRLSNTIVARLEYANQAKRQDAADWKKTCAEHGKTGMQYAQKAIDLQPDKPDGYYYYDVNIEAHLFLSELLIQTGGDANKAEAKGYLEKAAQSPDTYFRNWATRLLAEIGK